MPLAELEVVPRLRNADTWAPVLPRRARLPSVGRPTTPEGSESEPTDTSTLPPAVDHVWPPVGQTPGEVLLVPAMLPPEA